MDQEQPHQELVKCVVVGDTAVGKTRLICARACNKHVSLSQLLTTHVPTVWAIDQYRIYKDVLERSWEMIDGVNVSLRLWDTFGDHEKDRRFAYGRSDVVLLCFSVTSPVSLRNCAAMWYPEIRRFCPSTPVLLVGCKNDLRYMYRDETYLSFFRDHSPFVRATRKSDLVMPDETGPLARELVVYYYETSVLTYHGVNEATRKSDLVMPDEARTLARELGVYYYETSVLTYHGVNEVFENAIRAALLARRHQRFWITNLKRVQRPLLQEPFRPPRPLEPEVVVAASCYLENIAALFTHQYYADMVIICGSKGFPVHRLMLAATSETFHRLLTADLAAACELARSSSESSMVSSMGEATAGEFNEDTEHLIRQEHSRHHSPRVWEHIKRRSSCQILPSSGEGARRAPDLYREVNHPAIQSIRVVQCERRRGAAPTQTVVTMSKLVSQQVMLQLLTFFYSGVIDNAAFAQEIRQAADLLGCHELGKLMAAIQSQHHLLDADTMRLYHAPIAGRLGSLCVERALFADVTFELDDGLQAAHKALLVARCDPMRAMLQGHFRESTARVISLPGVDAYTFHKLLCYVYTDSIPGVEAAQCLSLLELANRLCMNRLVTLVEARVIEDLRRADHADAVDLCLSLLEPVKFHNAHGLAKWCLWRLCGAYDRVCRARALRQLHPDHRDYLGENRWPPVWYLKELDYYEKCCSEQVKEAPPRLRAADAAGATSDRAGCLCFSSKSRRESDDITAAATLFRSATSVHIPPLAPAPAPL